MGYYIECAEPKQKANQLLAKYSEIKEVKEPFFDYFGEVFMACVVENKEFDAVAIAYSPEALAFYRQNDGRQKRWLSIPTTLVKKLCPAAPLVLY